MPNALLSPASAEALSIFVGLNDRLLPLLSNTAELDVLKAAKLASYRPHSQRFGLTRPGRVAWCALHADEDGVEPCRDCGESPATEGLRHGPARWCRECDAARRADAAENAADAARDDRMFER
jgi:hypothetical protein